MKSFGARPLCAVLLVFESAVDSMVTIERTHFGPVPFIDMHPRVRRTVPSHVDNTQFETDIESYIPVPFIQVHPRVRRSVSLHVEDTQFETDFESYYLVVIGSTAWKVWR